MLLRVQVTVPLIHRLVLLYDEPVCPRPGILANARHLPAHPHRGAATGDLEAVVFDFLCNMEIWSRSTHRGELIVKRAVQRFEPGRKVDDSFAIGVEGDLPIVDVLHVGRLDKGVQKPTGCATSLLSEVERAQDASFMALTCAWRQQSRSSRHGL